MNTNIGEGRFTTSILLKKKITRNKVDLLRLPKSNMKKKISGKDSRTEQDLLELLCHWERGF